MRKIFDPNCSPCSSLHIFPTPHPILSMLLSDAAKAAVSNLSALPLDIIAVFISGLESLYGSVAGVAAPQLHTSLVAYQASLVLRTPQPTVSDSLLCILLYFTTQDSAYKSARWNMMVTSVFHSKGITWSVSWMIVLVAEMPCPAWQQPWEPVCEVCLESLAPIVKDSRMTHRLWEYQVSGTTTSAALACVSNAQFCICMRIRRST